MLDVYAFYSSHNFLETNVIEYLRMITSETMSTKACILCIVCINQFSQQAILSMAEEMQQDLHW